MQPADTFVPDWVHGLPASLLAPEGKTIAVIALMQKQAGLNRERRKALEGRFGSPGSAPSWARDLSRTDWTVLSHYVSGTFRFYNFWFVAGSFKAYVSKERYAHAVEVQLLSAYDDAWLAQTLDEAALTAACPHWPRIREGIVSMPNIRAGGLPLGVFMLWLRLVDDLRRFESLDDVRKLQVCHAVFALATAGRAVWFIDEAIRLYPLLDAELGLAARERVFPPAEAAHASKTGPAMPVASDLATVPVATDDSQWDHQVSHLLAVAEELQSQPTREGLEELIELSGAMARTSITLPTRSQPAAVVLDAGRHELRALLRSLAEQEAFAWLDEALLGQIEACWTLVVTTGGADAAERLAGDAAYALSRTKDAADAYLAVTSEVGDAAQESASLELEMAAAAGFGERAAIRRRHAEARKRQIDAEGVQHGRQEQLIQAGSPFGDTFDFDIDYVAKTACRDSNGLVSVKPTVSKEGGGNHDSDAPVPVDKTPDLLAAPVAAIIEPTSGDGPSIEDQASDADQDGAVHSDSDGQPADDLRDGAVVWDCLGQDEPGLAFQAARWVAEIRPETRLPSHDLLAATAFADALMIPEGALDGALRLSLERLDSGDFSDEAPAFWHTAVNLLLAAATLRPMILAPASGAGAVAAYLHHDGHYPALYALVQKLRELSAKLVGFRIDPNVLRRARGEAATRTELEALQRTARDWLVTQAPAHTIRYKPATDVWKQWLRPDGVIESIVSPVIHNRVQDAGRVRDALRALSDEEAVRSLIHETDRRRLRRRTGEDIFASALDHLIRLVNDALTIPRQWLALVDLLGGGGNRLRTLLEEVHVAVRSAKDNVERELTRVPPGDHSGIVAASQKQVLKALYGISALFDGGDTLPESEPSPAEVLGRACLLVPDIAVSESFVIETDAGVALQSLGAAESVLDGPTAQRTRMERGDMLGAELMVATGLVDADLLPLRQERERWKAVLRRDIDACREAVDIGSAYGYLQEAERTDIETHLARFEAGIDDERRFDVARTHIEQMQAQVAGRREDRKRDVSAALAQLVLTEDMHATARDAERALAGGDIAMANELLHWLQQGKAAPTDLDDEPSEGFEAFFPEAMTAIEQWLETSRPNTVIQMLADGATVPGAGTAGLDGAQRKRVALMFRQWSEMKVQGAAEKERLEGLLDSLGLPPVRLERIDRLTGREVWTLETAPIDRQVCAVPMFGSAAAGRFQVICVWGRPSEDDLLQWVGDPSMSRPAILLYFGRMTERKWRDLGRMSKTKRRSFLFLDETLLVYLCGISGSRVRAWFDTALPFSYSSPYDPTAGLVPPEMFYGRNSELEAVRSPDGRCFIYGGRQLGKTALLKRAEQSFHKPADDHYAKWIDLRAEGIGGSLAAGEIWVTLHERFRDMEIINASVPAPTPGKKQGSERVIRAIRAFLSENADRRILLLLDEADRFFEQDGRNDFEETRRLKQLMDETQRRFKVVFAGLHNVLRMTERANHPLAHFGQPIEIGPLREGADVKEAANLIRRPMEAAGFRFESKDLIIRVLAQTNYYPSLIQLYCSHLLRHMLEKVAASRPLRVGPRYTVSDRDIEQVYASDVLREEIRAKFRLTLQLDPRYEVLANAMALSLLRGDYSQSEGMAWQTIREECALRWWPEGFQDTSESDFRVLLDEMRGLGVLSRALEGRYVLRSANVLLLLGTQDEIEIVLNKERESVPEFDSALFRPPMRAAPHRPGRNIFTYQQLSQLLLRKNFITVVTGNEAAGIDQVVPNLRDYLNNGFPVVVDECDGRLSFGGRLQAALSERTKELSVFVVTDSVPWTDLWLKDAHLRLNQLRSDSRFVSLVFVAEPATLWRLLRDGEAGVAQESPWMSLLHWNDGYLRHWLEECQLPLEPDERGRLARATGLWPALISERVGERPSIRTLRERLAVNQTWPAQGSGAHVWRRKLGLDVGEPSLVLEKLAQWNDPLSAEEVADFGDIDLARVQLSLRWAELLGLAWRDGAGNWTVDPVAARVLIPAAP